MSLEWVLLGLRILATIILYTFLGVAFYIIWRDLKQLEGQATPQTQTTYQLRVVAAAEDQPLAVGETLPLQALTVLERTAENSIVVRDDPVTAAQTRLRQENGVWWLEDLGSDTLLNELPLSKPTPLAEGDIIGIGSLRFKLESSR